MRTLAAALTAALALSLTACSEDDPEPKIAPTESTSPSTPDTSPTEPPEQEPWEKNTRAGAVAFVKHWHDVFSDAQKDGDVALLRSLSLPGCQSCTQVSDQLEAIYSDGGFYRSKGWRVISATPGSGEGLPDDVIKMLIQVDRSPERFKASATSPVVRNPASQATYEARVQWVGESWAMERLVLLS